MKRSIIFPLLLISLVYSKTADLPFADVFRSPATFFSGVRHAARLYFSGPSEKDYHIQNIGDPIFEEIVFNYNLTLQSIVSKKNPSHEYTIYFHGWGDTKNSGLLVKEFTKTIPDNLVCFNFSDAQPIIGKLGKSSFGQLNDILPALYALKRAITILNLKTINMFGMSRGCAVVINMLALLNNDRLYNKHKPHLSLIGIDDQARIEILNVIQQGKIILDVPLRSVKLTHFSQTLIKHLTIHDEHIWDPTEMVHYLKGLKLNILVHYQCHDTVVSNTQEAEFFADLAASNHAGNTYLVMGNDGGHLHSHKALLKALPIFNELHQEKKYHPIGLKTIYRDELIRNGQLIRFAHPSSELIWQVLKRYYLSQSIIID